MWLWRRSHREHGTPEAALERVRSKYLTFRELLSLNNEALELMAGLQDDLQFVPPRRDVVGDRIAQIFGKVGQVIATLERLTGMSRQALQTALAAQQQETGRHCAVLEELKRPRLSAWLSEVNARAEEEVGAKAAMLGEIRNRLALPVPDGFILTTEAYRQYCGIPLWQTIRDACREADLNDLDAMRSRAEALVAAVMASPVPRAIEVAIAGRTATLLKGGGALAVRSSAKGEGGERSFAGQFESVLNVPPEDALEAYRRVIAARFSERALFYRLSTGLLEVDSPMAALFIRMLPARASGILYTRDPADARSKTVWITATRGLGLEIASGRMAADLFLVSRSRPHTVTERSLVHKEEELVVSETGGVRRSPLRPGAWDAASIQDAHLYTLAEWGVRVEEHFHTPQDIEWVLDENDALWIVQSRPLVSVHASPRSRSRHKGEPCLSGGRTVYPGLTSGPVFLMDDTAQIGKVPSGAVLFIRKPSPEIIEVFPRIAGLVAEWGNIAGHAAALLREFQIPSVFQMLGAFDGLHDGEAVSLDAVKPGVYRGTHWPPVRRELTLPERYGERRGDPISNRLLKLNLIDPAALEFRPSGCKSAHDILRYCHEKAIEAMFEVNDAELELGAECARNLVTPLPLNIRVLDLGGGVAPPAAGNPGVTPDQIVSRPFQALWKGVSHPAVTWLREMPASLSDLASVLANSLKPQQSGMRPLGEKSYLLVADEYMNLNSRLAYHYSLVDACLGDLPGHNYISFRFEGGGSTSYRRSLRACFLETCLKGHGFQVDRRSDLVNAWFRKAPAEQTSGRLEMLGRLLACSSQLDMYMTSREVMDWFVHQFMQGNYSFRTPDAGDTA